MNEDMFYKYEYSETKDLLKTFMTLVSGSLVLSITFAEKVVDFRNSAGPARLFLFVCWALFMLALVLCGLSMCFIAAAAGMVIYGNIPFLRMDGGMLAIVSWTLIIVAGAVFVSGLGCMAIAAASSMKQKRAETAALPTIEQK